MPNRVVLIADDELPENQEWAYASSTRGEYIFIKESAMCPSLLARVLAIVPPPRLRAAG
jgi:hypothetical protein